MTSQHYGKLWTGYCDYDQGPGFYYHNDQLPKIREIFLDFSPSFLLLSFPSMLFWDKEKTKEGQDQTKLFRLTKNAWTERAIMNIF